MTTEEPRPTSDHTKIQLKKILVPIDGSEYSFNAAEYATRIAKYEKSELFCIHVIGSVPYGYASSASATDQYYKDVEEKIESWFNKVRNMANVEGITEIRTETFMGVKSLVGSIIDYARSKGIDLIVIGTKGRTGLKRFLMGSVANGVAQHAHCPVLLVR